MAGQLFDGFASYMALIQLISERCVANHFQVNGSKVKLTRVILNFGHVYFIWLIVYACGRQPIESLTIWKSINCLHLQLGQGVY